MFLYIKASEPCKCFLKIHVISLIFVLAKVRASFQCFSHHDFEALVSWVAKQGPGCFWAFQLSGSLQKAKKAFRNKFLAGEIMILNVADDVCSSQQRFRDFPENLATRPPGRGRRQSKLTADRSLFQFNCAFVKNHAACYPMTLICRKR